MKELFPTPLQILTERVPVDPESAIMHLIREIVAQSSYLTVLDDPDPFDLGWKLNLRLVRQGIDFDHWNFALLKLQHVFTEFNFINATFWIFDSQDGEPLVLGNGLLQFHVGSIIITSDPETAQANCNLYQKELRKKVRYGGKRILNAVQHKIFSTKDNRNDSRST